MAEFNGYRARAGHLARSLSLIAAAALLAGFQLPAGSPPDPAAAFGARESVEDISLSPDGRRIAYLAPQQGQGSALYTVDLESGQSTLTTGVDGRLQRLNSCTWSASDRLVCWVFGLRRAQGDVLGASRLVALDPDGGNLLTLASDGGRYGGGGLLSVIDWRGAGDGAILVTSSVTGHATAVVRIDTRTDAVEVAQRAIPNARDFLSDGRGNIRMQVVQRYRGATGMASDEIEHRYRRRGSDDWEHFGVYNFVTRDGMAPLAIDPDLDAVYVLDKLDGRAALYRVSLDGSMRRELLVSHESVDVDGLLRLGRRGRVVGATYATETRQFVYFDPELRQLAARLSRALPNLPLIRVVGASDDESVLLIWAGSDRDPGRYYTYVKNGRRLNEIMVARPQLEGVALAEVRPVRFPASDGTSIPGYLTLPPGSSGRGLPAIVLPHGGPASRDEWGFDWLAQYFAHRGFAVLQPNFRGSAGYGDQWFQRNGFRSWRTAVGDVNDAGRWLVREGIADGARLAIVGWSYGGYAALQSAVLDPALYRAIVAIAPVTDLNLLREEARGWSDFRLMRDFVGSGPTLREGSPAQNAASIRAPVLMFHGDHDSNVDIRHSRLMRDRLSDSGRAVELVVFPGLDHGLDDSAARARMLRESEAFIRARLAIQ